MVTTIIVNPYAGGGRAAKLWTQLEPRLKACFGTLNATLTYKPDDLARALEQAYAAGTERVIAIGGDGTSNLVVDALLHLQQRYPNRARPVFGQIPIGTGQDFARALNIPRDPLQAVEWLAGAKPHPLDVGHLEYSGQSRYFLNIASVGISGEVDRRVNLVKKRRPWTFHMAAIMTIIAYQPRAVRVELDGQPWYEGTTWVTAVANGSRFGRGMMIAPDAKIDDGLFDVILVEGISRLKILWHFNKLYTGKHIRYEFVRSARAKQVDIIPLDNKPVDLDIDGEYTVGHPFHFSVQSGRLEILMERSNA